MESTSKPCPSVLTRLPELTEKLRTYSNPEDVVPELLKGLAEMRNAEHALFIRQTGNETVARWSATIDGDPLAHPDSRIPKGLLEAVRELNQARVTCRGETTPPEVQKEFESLNLKGGLLYRLKEHDPHSPFVFLENRFCPLQEDEFTNSACSLMVEILKLCLWTSELKQELDDHASQLSKAEALIAELRRPEAAAQKEPQTSTSSSSRKRCKTFKGDYSSIVTNSPRMHSIFSVLDKISHTSAPVLLTGQSGTGKELVAKSIHKNSPRAGSTFIPENCAALTETLLESELFGYKKGAFTGANENRKGLFELADGGTLFLDEVGEMSPNMQKKLLRVLQEGVIRPVGGKEFIEVDVRIISATNRDLNLDVQNGSFREDLYYRLNVITIDLPRLRDRMEDMPLLAEHFLSELAQKNGESKIISQEALQVLQSYSWPGNVRELQNEIQRAYTLAEGTIGPGDLSKKIRSSAEDGGEFSITELETLPLRRALESFECELLKRALQRYNGNKTKVSEALKLPKTSLYHKLQKHNLK